MADIQESRSERFRRRIVTIPRSVLLFVVLTVAAPAVAALAALVDAIRFALFGKPAMALRMVAFAWVYLAAELWGITRFFGQWVAAGFGARQRWMVDRGWAVQCQWASTLLGAVQRLFDLDLRVVGLENAAPGPIIAMFRHASIIDNLLPAVLLTDQAGIKLRWIIKKELLGQPALDVGGNRLPNYFVDRDSKDPRGELRRIKAMTVGLREDEGVLIFPEGTRFSEERRARALERLAASDPAMHAAASRLRNVMPPRLGGVLTLLDSGADVVVCAHEGLGGFATLRDIWSGSLVGRTVRIELWRIAASDIPKARQERVAWLLETWQHVDDWIESAGDPPGA
ncbi:MAG TPA: 1-acyl-sn-glycerol-3-phosphate acyltransferase [Acidimicrobiia bacterium]|jgi:1-acyl-sn-glycerol-3-phosphate acyltransferase